MNIIQVIIDNMHTLNICLLSFFSVAGIFLGNWIETLAVGILVYSITNVINVNFIFIEYVD